MCRQREIASPGICSLKDIFASFDKRVGALLILGMMIVMIKKATPVLFAIFALCALPSAAHASLFDGPKDIAVQVVNSNGAPQPGATVWVQKGSEAQRLGKNSQGWVSPRPYSLGSRVYAVRHPSAMWSNFDPSSVPEGKNIFHDIVASSPGSVQLVLPALDHPSYLPFQPEISPAERVFVGLVNDERRRLCVAPVQISSVLSEVADRYANYLSNERGQGSPHYWYWDSDLRAKDGGWPGAATEALSWGNSDPESAYGGLFQSPPHYKILFGSEEEISDCNQWPRFIGASRASGVYGPYWVVMLGGCGDPEDGVFSPACGATGDFGDSSALDPPQVFQIKKHSVSKSAVRIRVHCTDDCQMRISGKTKNVQPAIETESFALGAENWQTVTLRYTKKASEFISRPGRSKLWIKAQVGKKSKTISAWLP